ncbi:hypothetical protein ACLKA7_012083 [Drosophila subpalustris]
MALGDDDGDDDDDDDGDDDDDDDGDDDDDDVADLTMRVMGGPWIGPKRATDHDNQAATLHCCWQLLIVVVVVHWNMRWQINQCRPQQ